MEMFIMNCKQFLCALKITVLKFMDTNFVISCQINNYILSNSYIL